MIKGKCPYCKKNNVMLLKHHLDYKTDLTVYICQDCHYKEHFPNGKNADKVVKGNISKRQIVEIDDSGHFGKTNDGDWIYLSKK